MESNALKIILGHLGWGLLIMVTVYGGTRLCVVKQKTQNHKNSKILTITLKKKLYIGKKE